MKEPKWEQAAHDVGDLRREMQEGHGGSLVNMLVGLIINSCDAYERIQHPGPREIHIEVERNLEKTAGGRAGKGHIRVVDWAEGMDLDDFSNNFSSYGSAKSGWAPGKKIGGLFGREASDIMWSNVASRYICIKGGRGYFCEFRPVVDFRRRELDRRSTKQFQEMYKAKKRNLTIADFYLHEDYRFPPFPHLVDGLSRHFRLRLINSNPEVKIMLHYTDSRGKKRPERICFVPLETEGEGADLVDSHEFKLTYKRYPPFRAEARLYRKRDRDLSQSGTDREGGLLVVADDDTALELGFFDYDNTEYTAYIRRFFGYVRLHVASILHEEMRRAERRLALIEVDRSRLKRRTELYDVVRDSIALWLKPIVEAEQERTAVRQATEQTDRWNRQLHNLFAEINQIINQKTGRSGAKIKSNGAPPETLRFGRDKITTSAGTVYRIDLLFNTQVIEPGTRFGIQVDNPHIRIEPTEGAVPEPNYAHFPHVARIVVCLQSDQAGEHALVKAIVTESLVATVELQSIEPDVYFPNQAIEWWPDDFKAIRGEVSHPTLWVDLIQMADGAMIRILPCSDSIEVLDPVIVASNIPIVKEDLSKGIKIGKLRPRFRASGRSSEGELLAECDSTGDLLAFSVIEHRQRIPSGDWTFTGIEFEEGLTPEVDVYPNGDGKVCLNLKHALVAHYFGNTRKEAAKAVKEDVGLARLAAHMVVDFILNHMSRMAWRSEDTPNPNMEIGTRDASRMDQQIYNYVMKLKNQYGTLWVDGIATVLTS